MIDNKDWSRSAEGCKREIIKRINALSGSRSPYEVFCDWVKCYALAIQTGETGVLIQRKAGGIVKKELSKKENKYRIKITQENHYSKDEQKIMDLYIQTTDQSYREIYEGQRNGMTYLFMVQIGIGRFNKYMVHMSKSSQEVAEGLAKISAELRANLRPSVQDLEEKSDAKFRTVIRP